MATIALTTDIDVVSKYEALVKSSLGSESVYARLKDNLKALSEEGDLSDADKAKVVAEALAQMGTSISNASMSTALQWAAQEKELYLKKFELEYQSDILAKEKLLKEAQIDKVAQDKILAQVQNRALYGTYTALSSDGNVTGVNTTGSKTAADVAQMAAQTTNLGKEGTLLDAKLKESYATVNKIVADTVTNYGMWNGYTLNEDGVRSASRSTATGINYMLSDIQANIAKQQAQGYAYNAWANAATSSAGVLGTLMANGYGLFTEDRQGDGDAFLSKVDSVLDRLTKVDSAYPELAGGY